MKLISAFAVLATLGASSAFAQSYSAPGNDPVRSHTYLGDSPIDPNGGGTLCYRSVDGVVCKPVSHQRRFHILPKHRAHHSHR